ADGKPAWTFPTAGHGAVNMVPASAQGRVLFGAEDGTFWCLDLVEGHELWRVETGGILGWTNPVVVKDRVVFADRGGTQQGGGDDNADDVKGSRRGELRCLSLEDGKELWHAAFDMTGFSTPGVGPGYVVGGFGRQVARFDLAKGKISERVATGTNAFGSPTVVGDSLVFGNLDGNLYVHDLENADLRWRFHLAEGQQALDFVHGGDRIYLSTTVGLYCLGDGGSNRKAKKGFVLEAGAPPPAR
ncbi:MAG TPA: PQQ-binding-like beta-propeller repeat protein, partial [Planctomycetota bacterium]